MTNIVNDSTTTTATMATSIIITAVPAATNNSVLEQFPYMYSLENSNYGSILYDFEQTTDFGPRRDSLKIVIPVTIIYALIFVTGIIGNFCTCIVIKKNRSMHTATNYYLFSLAISDFLLLLSGVPLEIYLTWSKYPYVFGEYFCVGRGILAETTANATVLTITAFTVERYVAICHPFLDQAFSKLSRALCIIIFIWLFSILTAIPQALQFGIVSHHGVERCVVVRIIINHSFQLSTYVFFFIPMSIIFVLYLLIGLQLYRSNFINGNASGCHHSFDSKDMKRFRSGIQASLNVRRGRFGSNSTQSDTILYRYSGGTQNSDARGRAHQFSTKRVLKMLVAVVICFFLCWAPFHAQRLIAVYGSGVSLADSSTDVDIHPVSETTEGKLFHVTAPSAAATVTNHTDTDRHYLTGNERVHHEIVYTVLTYISGVLYYLSTCINPLLYNLMSNKFRQAFKCILLGKSSTNVHRSQISERSMGRKPNTKATSVHRNSSVSEIQSKLLLLQSITKGEARANNS